MVIWVIQGLYRSLVSVHIECFLTKQSFKDVRAAAKAGCRRAKRDLFLKEHQPQDFQHLPTMVCLVRASWLICTSSPSSWPAGSVWVSLK